MERRIEELGRQWKEMPRNNAEEIMVADSFYNENIMPLSAQKFLSEYRNSDEKYNLMFVTVGTSWQPIALSIMAKNPAKVIFLATEGVKKDIDIALKFMAEQGLPLSEYETVIVDKAESRPLLMAVRNAYILENPKKACFDITGGTKSMAAAAGMIAAFYNMDIYYVESNYLPVYRHPEPGSEIMVKLDRPQDLD